MPLQEESVGYAAMSTQQLIFEDSTQGVRITYYNGVLTLCQHGRCIVKPVAVWIELNWVESTHQESRA